MREPEIIRVTDETVGLDGYVVIDSTIRGEASGGLRIHPAVDVAELRSLARTMTLKYGFYGLPKGGAKAGFRADPEGDPGRIRELLGAFGRGIRPLMEKRRYFPGPDLGTDDARIRYLFAQTGLRAGSVKHWKLAESGPLTAVGVVQSFLRAARRSGIDPRDSTVHLEGLGAVGSAVLSMLAERGVRVIAVANRHGRVHSEGGIDPESWRSFVEKRGSAEIGSLPGAEPIGREEFFGLPTTAFLPCAASFSIRQEDAEKLRTRMIVPGANDPFSRATAETIHRRGILVVPDFVTNAGGVLGGALIFGGLGPAAAESRVSSLIGRAVDGLLEHAERLGSSPIEVAESIADARFERMKKTPSSRLLLLGLALRRRGLVPRGMSRFFTKRYTLRMEKNLLDGFSTERAHG